jgi:3-dehydroquinate synthase
MKQLSVDSGQWTVFLYGPPRVGKSTLGRKLAQRLHLPFLDSDERIEAQAGRPIPEIFAREGESGFRKRETQVLLDAVSASPGVISLGGGALLSPQNRETVERAGRVICLLASLETLAKRVSSTPDDRPLLAGDRQAELRALLEKRETHYRSFDFNITTDGLSPEDVLHQIQIAAGQFYPQAMGAGYRVLVQKDGLAHLPDLVAVQEPLGPVMLVSDENVAELYADQVLEMLHEAGHNAKLVAFPPGEEHKNNTTLQTLWDAFLEYRLERGGLVLALGGGVTGDMAGFAAATYMRGVRWAALPTTLLAMVDASLGGKTGVDRPQGKNLVGAFHPPAFVLIDPSTLETLPQEEFRSGMAEVVKHGVISDPELFALCENLTGLSNLSDLDEIIRRAVAVKINIIEQDPYEESLRAALNLGHTIGHAVEAVSDYQIKHGQAVAIGMVAEAKLSEMMGLAEAGLSVQIASLLRDLGLPTQIPAHLDREAMFQAMQVDKKRSRRAVRFALPLRIGEVRVGVEIPDLRDLFFAL